MNSCSVKKLRLLPIIVVSALLFLAMAFATTAQAKKYYVYDRYYPYHYHYDRYYPYRYYYAPWRYHRGAYWTGWRSYYYRHGYRCQRSCLINWNGVVIRCAKRCI
ncbi:Uncharacterised protein [Legionella lansingensis]|uniref:Uncharacterized protein n=1 Tax=Legionella lansingensis TaxID=45067 RepID=A0A0W0VGN2_9GAMM|nr:hypothetical protein [Legionella lansingensis]KTD19263.1 hypothetical protein Llan_2115 [Legionella lansingensis]SNV50573.1 Uncharacterised protein [Legionella lansingensis]